MRKWRIEDSAELYNITGWGLKYFSINEKGHVTVTPKEGSAAVDLKELMDELQVRDVPAPILVRFPDILDNRIEKISNCFKQAANEYGYTAQNFIIYPIKVNQMSPVVEEIVSHGKKFNIGLEAGSKPELHAVLAINIDANSLIICNGYKDENYIELALLAQKMGRRIFLVVEKLNELHLIANIAKRLKIRPNIGIRIKLASSGSGKWEDSGGDVSKFGLNSSELLEALDILEKNKMKDCLKLIHFHIGSQVTKIRLIKNALREASQFYVQLYKMGYNIEFVDIGGGLGVDYDGTRSSTSESSMNYSIQEYVNDSIWTLVDVCAKNDLPQPNIITESGRIRSPLTTRCSYLKCSKRPPCPNGTTTPKYPRPTTNWCANSTTRGTTSTSPASSKPGTTPCKSEKRPSTSSDWGCSTCAPVPKSNDSSGR